ncbi:hypothetical protein BKA70DRAFT_1446713 [Coprinopsis sp. MPI-PUGE-AT-0042]|nr:hypothetical protein BKA70DRAFT_1446713 [Coprinopsis sp. MPI-PUGE-AT-0042]
MELVGSSDLGSPSWSRQDSAFLRSYPWDDTVLLVGAARDLEKNFQAQEGDSAMVDPALRSDLPSHGHSHGASGAEAQSVQHFVQPLIRAFLRHEATDVLSPYGQAHERMIQQLILSKAATASFVECPEPDAILRTHKVAKGTQASNLLCRYIALLRVVDIASDLRLSATFSWPLSTCLGSFLAISTYRTPFSQAAVPSAATTAAEEGAKFSNVHVDTPQTFSQGIRKTRHRKFVSSTHLLIVHLPIVPASYVLHMEEEYGSAAFADGMEFNYQLPRALSNPDNSDPCQAAIHLGNDRPPVIARAEKVIFSVVFGIANGTMTARSGVQHLIDSIPWSPSQISLTKFSFGDFAFFPTYLIGSILIRRISDALHIEFASSTPAGMSTVEPLQAFALRIQSAAISASALGLNLDESTIQQLISGIPPSRNAAIMPPPAAIAIRRCWPGVPYCQSPHTSHEDLHATPASAPLLPPAPSSESENLNGAGSGPSQAYPIEEPGTVGSTCTIGITWSLPGPLTPDGSSRPFSPDILDVDMQKTPASSTFSSPLSSPPSTPSIPDLGLDDFATVCQQLSRKDKRSQSNGDISEKATTLIPKPPSLKTTRKPHRSPRRKPRPKRPRAPSHEEESPRSMDEKSDVRPPKKAKGAQSHPPSIFPLVMSISRLHRVDRILNTARELGPPAKSKILLPDQDPKKVKANPPLMPEGGYTFYDPLGKPVIWEPLFYGKDNKRFDDWASAIKANFCSGRNVWTKQRKLAIVQTNCQHSAAIEFNNAGMATLTGRIDVEIEVQDQSAERGSYATISAARSRRTTLQHLVEYSNIAIEKRPIVNALNLPLTPGLRPEQKFPFSSEYVAWMRTLGNSLCLDAYPTSHTRWSLVAFDGALHYLHIDSDGFGTWVEVKHGAKLWVIARPKDGTFKNKDGTEEAIPSFGDINGFLKFFGHGGEPKQRVLGRRGYGVEAWISTDYGSQHDPRRLDNGEFDLLWRTFYSVATLLPTVVGGGFTAESDDKEHLPSFDDPDMFAGTFALLCFMELQNVLDFRSYACPHNEISSIWYQRGWNVSTPGVSLKTSPPGYSPTMISPLKRVHKLARVMLDPWVGFYFPYLAHFMVAIDVYKASYPRSITKKFGIQTTIKSIAPPFTYSIVKREEPHEFLPDTPEELTANGYRGGDRIYIEAYKEALAYQAHRRRAEQSHC